MIGDYANYEKSAKNLVAIDFKGNGIVNYMTTPFYDI